MAFSSTGLNLVSGSKAGNAPQIWSYKTTDAAATVDTAGYFDNGSTSNTGMRNVMKVGDLIYRVTTSGGSFSTAGLHVVITNASGIINVSDATVLGGTNTD
jgi:hypothetical protein